MFQNKTWTLLTLPLRYDVGKRRHVVAHYNVKTRRSPLLWIIIQEQRYFIVYYTITLDETAIVLFRMVASVSVYVGWLDST